MQGGSPDYQLVYFFWEKGKVGTVVSRCKTTVGLRRPVTIKIHISTEIAKTSHPKHFIVRMSEITSWTVCVSLITFPVL